MQFESLKRIHHQLRDGHGTDAARNRGNGMDLVFERLEIAITGQAFIRTVDAYIDNNGTF